MKIAGVHHLPADWASSPAEERPGDAGTARWHTIESGEVRTRIVEYSAGYRADHWCPRGHVLLVLEGELAVSLRDGTNFRLGPGSGFVLPDDPANPHTAASEKGARVFIVD